MNVKFKMPKFGRDWTGKSWLKELLLTFLGTTISIVLTFGTSHWLDSQRKKAAGRQMAMMVIHDIDENVQSFRDMEKTEKEYYELAQYVLNNLDQINSIPEDTLTTVYYMLLRDIDYTIDDSKEKIFHSSPDSWKSIDNSQFIDVVQQFYYERRNYQSEMNIDPMFIAPFSMEDHFQYVVEAEDKTDLYALSKRVLSKKLRDPRVEMYILYSPMRQSFYEKVANTWQQKSDQCKFLMGITDDELKEYVEKNNRTGRQVKQSELIGKWKSTSTSDENMETIEFRKDHTFVHSLTKNRTHIYYTGSIEFVLTMPGQWSLEGDTLVRTYLPGAKHTIDASNITYSKEMKDSALEVIRHNEEIIAKKNEEYKTRPVIEGRKANAISIDRSGDKIEMKYEGVNEDGEQENKSEYLSRLRVKK